MNDRRDRLNDLHRINDALRSDARSPDLSASILARVDAERGFVCRRGRALVWAGRAGAATTVALVALGLALAYRANPGSLDLASRATPASDVIDSVSARAAAQLVQIRGAVEPTRSANELSAVIVGVAPIGSLAGPIGLAVQATTFVGPPVPSTLPQVAPAPCGRLRRVGPFDSLLASAAPQSPWPRAERAEIRPASWIDDDGDFLMNQDGPRHCRALRRAPMKLDVRASRTEGESSRRAHRYDVSPRRTDRIAPDGFETGPCRTRPFQVCSRP